MSVYTDFQKFVNDLEASSTYKTWCSHQASDCAAWQTYRTGLLTLTPPPSPPAMSTSFGKALVDVGIMAVDAGLVAPPPPKPLTAAFSFAVSGLNVSFTDLSTPGPSGPITAWHWDFGDTTTSPLQNPTHAFPAGTTHTVTLTVTSADGSSPVSHSVTVGTPAVLAANFSETSSGLTATFTDHSTPGPSGPITAWDMDFGDASPHGSGPGPWVHPYAAGGTYTATLTVTGTAPDGTALVHKSIFVTSTPSSGVYWGARINGIVYSTYYGAPNSHYAPWAAADAHPNNWDRFESHAGKQVCSIQWAGGNQGQSFDGTAASLTHSRNAFSQMDLGASASQMQSLAAGTDPGGVFATLATALNAFNHPIMVRPFWEMNGNWGWGWQTGAGITPAIYRAAFKKLVSIIRAHAPNVSIFWCCNQYVTSGGAPDPTPWFLDPNNPSDTLLSYVDWVGLDAYNFGTNESPDAIFDLTLAKVKSLAPGLPIGIGETGCKAPTNYTGGKAAWVTAFFAWLKAHPEIKWFSWFADGNFTQNNYIEIGNSAGQINSTALAAWAAGIADSRYLAAPAGSFVDGQKVPIPV